MFETSAWAINGALLSSELARRAEYAATGGAQGIVNSDDLKVTQLSVPGVGIQVAGGVGLLRNGYQTDPNETYVVSNDSAYTVPSESMPPANAAAKEYIVAVVVGDPDFSQAGHPFMLATDPPAGEETTFQYVRVSIIEVPSGSKTIAGATYPYLPLARLVVPANTTTITDSMIVDLRTLALPRSSQEMFVSGTGGWEGFDRWIPSGSAFQDWGNDRFSPSVLVPTWATRCILSARINGVILNDTSVNVGGSVRAQFGSTEAGQVKFDMPVGTGAIRTNLEAAGQFAVSEAQRGTSQALRIEGYENVPASPSLPQRLKLTTGSQIIYDVRFFEE